MSRRTIYGTPWECLSPGRWRSPCGWYIAQRAGRRLWIGTDISEPKSTWYADSLTSLVWQLIPQERRDYYRKRAGGR